jgi:hypothetical protein
LLACEISPITLSMADPEYQEVIRLLILLNSSVKFIVVRLHALASQLDDEKILSSDYIDRLTKATMEVDRFLKKPDVTL